MSAVEAEPMSCVCQEGREMISWQIRIEVRGDGHRDLRTRVPLSGVTQLVKDMEGSRGCTTSDAI
jgi:hypothetical protein